MKRSLAALFPMLLLAACAAPSAPPLSDRLAQMSPAQRDRTGHEAAQILRSTNNDRGVRDIRYRAADDSFVYTVVLDRLRSTRGINTAVRNQIQNDIRRNMAKEVCRKRVERDIITKGGYAIVYRLLAADGKLLTAVRISGKDCR